MKKTIADFQSPTREKITMLTAYDYPTAKILEKAEIDCILVGDSLGMAVLGYDSTIYVTIDDMVHHCRAVRRGAPNTFIIADMPYLTYTTPTEALENAKILIQNGQADAVKLEGGVDYYDIIQFLNRRGIPVVGHIGLTPQTATQLSGFKVQGRDLESALALIEDAKAVQNAGAFMIVLEAIPSELAHKITTDLFIPTIGIGAGEKCSGQVLVFHDLVGLFDRFVPRFVKQYVIIEPMIKAAIETYCQEVKDCTFPNESHIFKMNEEVIRNLYNDK